MLLNPIQVATTLSNFNDILEIDNHASIGEIVKTIEAHVDKCTLSNFLYEIISN